MKSSYRSGDVELLLKDVSGMLEPLDISVREKRIQSGVHYSEMLPLEKRPSAEYTAAYNYALEHFAEATAKATAEVAERIYAYHGGSPVLVSLARAGTPAGILIKHYIEKKYKTEVPHYSISIIRGRGIDKNAMKYILDRHSPQSIRFVDGWTGKGTIQRQLNESMADYPEIDPRLAVLSDPAGMTRFSGTKDDLLIANSCLNSTTSGLISRTIFNKDVIGDNDFHGAVYFGEFADIDMTYDFIDTVESRFDISAEIALSDSAPDNSGYNEALEVAKAFGVDDINFVKPGIGETTRVLLRRLPWKILVHSLDDNENLGHIYRLAEEKGAKIEVYPLKKYKACGIIRKLADN